MGDEVIDLEKEIKDEVIDLEKEKKILEKREPKKLQIKVPQSERYVPGTYDIIKNTHIQKEFEYDSEVVRSADPGEMIVIEEVRTLLEINQISFDVDCKIRGRTMEGWLTLCDVKENIKYVKSTPYKYRHSDAFTDQFISNSNLGLPE